MYVRTSEALRRVPTSYLYDSSSPLGQTFSAPKDLVCPEDPKCPKGLICLGHTHSPRKPTPKTLGRFTTEPEACLAVGDMNPLFLDANDNLIIDESSTGLHTALRTLIMGKYSKYLGNRVNKGPSTNDRLRVALVDITGDKITQPRFAGWGSTVAADAASCAKIAPLYAAFQLQNDLKHLAAQENLTTIADLIRSARDHWKKAHLPDSPKLSQFLDAKANPPNIDFSSGVKVAFANIIDQHKANYAARVLIDKVGFSYIASLMWQSGLRHPTRGGLWLLSSYGRPVLRWKNAPRPSPEPVYGHTATALSLVTYFTLLAQGRLVNEAASGEIKRRLSTASWFNKTLPSANIASKVGLLATHVHEAGLIENGRFRYAVAIMTVGIPEGISLLQQLIGELDSLIRANNP